MIERVETLIAKVSEILPDEGEITEAQAMAAARIAYMQGHHDGVIAREDEA